MDPKIHLSKETGVLLEDDASTEKWLEDCYISP